MRPGPAYLFGQFFVRGAEVVQQLLIGGRLLQRVELLPVQVLHQRVAEHVVVPGGPHDGRDMGQLSALRCPPAAFPHDQFVPPGASFADDNRLQQAHFPDGVGQLVQGLLVEHLAGLTGIGGNRRDRQFLEVRAADRTVRVGGPAVGSGWCPVPAQPGLSQRMARRPGTGPVGMSAPSPLPSPRFC